MAPGHVGIAHALQNPHRQIEMQRADAEQMVATFLDQMLGDGIGIAVERGLVIDAVALERRFRSPASCGATSAARSCRRRARSVRDRPTARACRLAPSWRASKSAIHPPIEEPTRMAAALADQVEHGPASSSQSPIEASQQIALGQPMARIVEAEHGQAHALRPRGKRHGLGGSPCPTESPKAREWPGIAACRGGKTIGDAAAPAALPTSRNCGSAAPILRP